MDADQLTMFQKFAEGVDFSENGQAMDAIREVGPGSHYLGCTHTQANFETAFWRSGLADNNSFEQWRDDGEKDIVVRANTQWKKMLRDYEAPPLDPGIDEAASGLHGQAQGSAAGQRELRFSVIDLPDGRALPRPFSFADQTSSGARFLNSLQV